MPEDRQTVIRRHFEAHRDLAWFEHLEPGFREQGMRDKELQSLRDMWNKASEKRDWEWWQKEVGRTPNERLEDEIMDITDRLDQLGCLRWQQEKGQKLVRECFDLERSFHYWEFRQSHSQDALMVSRLPDPAEREKVLKANWERRSEEIFPKYRESMAGLSIEELEAEKEQWLDRLSCLSEREYKEMLAEAASRQPANDNDKGKER